jgi:hypothetical protein
MGYRNLVLIVVLAIVSNYSIGQKRNNQQSIDRYSDSIVLSYLIKYFPNDSLWKKEIIRNGKVQKIRKYYDYVSFSLPVENTTKIIKIVNFGALIEHTPSFMLVMKMSDNVAEEHFVLGKESLEEDLITMQQLFSSLPTAVKEKHKLEVMDIFLQSRLGIGQTSCYIY